MIPDGKYKVTGLTGSLRALRNNVKHIRGTIGYNLWCGIVKWGHFDITEYAHGYTLTYRKGGIVDTVHFVSPRKLMGKFFKDRKFVGKFMMERI